MKKIDIEFNEKDIESFKLFKKYLDDLRKSKFFSEGLKELYTYKGGKFNTSLSEDEIDSFMIKFRKLFFDSSFNFIIGRFKEILHEKYLDHPLNDIIKREYKKYKKYTKEKFFFPFAPTKKYSISNEKLIDNYFNGEIFHTDIKKRAILQEFKQELNSDDDLRFAIINLMFLMSINMLNIGIIIVPYFNNYCKKNNIKTKI